MLWYVTLVVSASAIASIHHGTLPYFPIEISRFTADGGPVSMAIFRYGLMFLPIFVWEWSYYLVGAYVGLLMVLFFNDVDHWELHMLGVCIMGAGGAGQLLIKGSTLGLMVAFGLWMSRVVLKVAVVLVYEGATVFSALEKAKHIMYTGRCLEPDMTLKVFRYAGFLQWVVFGIIIVNL